ncbi:hypothetical protein [Leucobacter sp. cx-169]|uniref:hypothetical protein n=1 Tax=Leucobacter sp. cx-169 TaxID=2770549 RepID=UPI00165E6A54|nr:hypothetical protein [Leucobacter sp. cx-169]MBC9927206.1 hypothetical protein [Leucobacter sp. cx-169]
MAESALRSDVPEPCVMTHTPPFDFAVCETHDETFPVGGVCKWHGRTSIADVLQDEVDAQRARAVFAEEARERAEQELRAARLAEDVVIAMARDVIAGARLNTHYAGCEEVHVACFAARVAEALCAEPDLRPHSPMLLPDQIQVCSDCVNSEGHLIAYEQAHPVRMLLTAHSDTEGGRDGVQ